MGMQNGGEAFGGFYAPGQLIVTPRSAAEQMTLREHLRRLVPDGRHQ